jgi:hypothetical protein
MKTLCYLSVGGLVMACTLFLGLLGGALLQNQHSQEQKTKQEALQVAPKPEGLLYPPVSQTDKRVPPGEIWILPNADFSPETIGTPGNPSGWELIDKVNRLPEQNPGVDFNKAAFGPEPAVLPGSEIAQQPMKHCKITFQFTLKNAEQYSFDFHCTVAEYLSQNGYKLDKWKDLQFPNLKSGDTIEFDTRPCHVKNHVEIWPKKNPGKKPFHYLHSQYPTGWNLTQLGDVTSTWSWTCCK